MDEQTEVHGVTPIEQSTKQSLPWRYAPRSCSLFYDVHMLLSMIDTLTAIDC
jgi:hypothetical protein